MYGFVFFTGGVDFKWNTYINSTSLFCRNTFIIKKTLNIPSNIACLKFATVPLDWNSGRVDKELFEIPRDVVAADRRPDK